MSSTTFSGPVTSTNGFVGAVTATTVTATIVTATTVAATNVIATGAVIASGVTSLTNASISMTALPTADPLVVGRLWNNAGVLNVSAG